MTSIVDLSGVSFSYGDGRRALRDLGLQVAEGEHVAVVGRNGSGKSTLGRVVAGLEAPAEAVAARVCGHDLMTATERRLVRRSVGILFQDPESQMVGATVEEDVAFGLENLGLPAGEIAQRVEQMLRRFRLEELRLRGPHMLSGGQKQRTALAGVMAIPRRALVLDEPTAMLDAEGAGEVRAAVGDLLAGGLTVLWVTQEMGEVPLAHRVVALEAGQVVFSGRPQDLFFEGGLLERLSLGAPLSTEVAFELRRRGRPLPGMPMTVDELADALLSTSGRRDGRAGAAPVGDGPEGRPTGVTSAGGRWRGPPTGAPDGGDGPGAAAADELLGSDGGMAVGCHGLAFAYGSAPEAAPALEVSDLRLEAGSATALLGRSGAGKSTLLLLLRGLLTPRAGQVSLDGVGQTAKEYPELQRRTGLVFQRAEAQLFAATAFEDVAFGPRQFGRPASEVHAAGRAAMEAVGLPFDEYRDRHPYSLSGGEQRRLALAGVLAMRPRLLLLDEPTVGLDPGGRRDLLAVLRRLKRSGVTLVLATHDVDLAWGFCEHRVVLDGGRLVAHGGWSLEGAGGDVLRQAGLAEPQLSHLWRRLGLVTREPMVERPSSGGIPRTAAEAAERLVAQPTPGPAGLG